MKRKRHSPEQIIRKLRDAERMSSKGEGIVRVEVFAVHPDEKPEDVPQITGFRGHPEQLDHKYAEPKPAKPGR